MVLDVIPVVPPDLRPMVLLDSGKFETTDLTELYQRVIGFNNRLKKLISLQAPEIIIKNSKRHLQQSVDNLFDNQHSIRPVLNSNSRCLCSLAGYLANLREARSESKQTVIDTFLERPIDYCAKTRVIVENTDSIDSAFVPVTIAFEIFQPMIISELKRSGAVDTIKKAKRHIEARSKEANEALGSVSKVALMLVGIDSSKYPLIALQPQLGDDNALKVNPDLLEFLGWDVLGQTARVFAVLTEDGRCEARQSLLPSRLIEKCSCGRSELAHQESIRRSTGLSIQVKDLISQLAFHIITGQPRPVRQYDQLVLSTSPLKV